MRYLKKTHYHIWMLNTVGLCDRPNLRYSEVTRGFRASAGAETHRCWTQSCADRLPQIIYGLSSHIQRFSSLGSGYRLVHFMGHLLNGWLVGLKPHSKSMKGCLLTNDITVEKHSCYFEPTDLLILINQFSGRSKKKGKGNSSLVWVSSVYKKLSNTADRMSTLRNLI